MPKYAIKINKNNTDTHEHTYNDKSDAKATNFSSTAFGAEHVSERMSMRNRESQHKQSAAAAAAAAVTAAAEGKFSVPPKHHEILCVLCLYVYARVYVYLRRGVCVCLSTIRAAT